jgi:signal transduction histidine kinase
VRNSKSTNSEIEERPGNTGESLATNSDRVLEIEKRAHACEIELDDARGLASTRERLLLENIKELNDVYKALKEKIGELREKDARIRSFDELMTRTNRLSSLGELAASIAHEIKNPLISIEGFAKRIETTDDLSKIRKYANFVEQESERLSAVLVRLLDFSRMTEPNRERHDLNEIVEDTILFTEHHLTRFRNINLSVQKEDPLPKVCADKIHVQQALINIIMNAAQAMPEGGPLTIETGRRGAGYVWIAVTDNGAGIEETDLTRIFEPFYTTKAKGEGTGLGLSLTKKLVEANMGTIEVESVKGQGSTFRLLFPVSEDNTA